MTAGLEATMRRLLALTRHLCKLLLGVEPWDWGGPAVKTHHKHNSLSPTQQ
jgi:hypothetical protein